MPGDSTSSLPEVPPINGYGGSGDVTAEVVYVNYGLIEDYATLDSLGVSVRGKDRHRALRTLVPRHQGARGRAPRRGGAAHLQRPAGRRLRSRRRLSRPARCGPRRACSAAASSTAPAIRRRPARPAAREPGASRWRSPASPQHSGRADLVRQRAGAAARSPRHARFRRRGRADSRSAITSGPGPCPARVAVATDTATAPYKTIWNTFGIIRGSEFPDEMVVDRRRIATRGARAPATT